MFLFVIATVGTHALIYLDDPTESTDTFALEPENTKSHKRIVVGYWTSKNLTMKLDLEIKIESYDFPPLHCHRVSPFQRVTRCILPPERISRSAVMIIDKV